MRVKLSTNHRNFALKRSKSLKRRQKDFENNIKQLIAESVAENNNNKELVDKNVSLLAEVETLRKEKLELFEKFMFKRNPNQMIIKNDLMVFLETLKTDRKQMTDLFQKANEFFNKMINKISDKLEELIEYEDKRVELNVDSNQSNVNSAEKHFNSKEIYEMRQMLRQNNCIQTNDLSPDLSVIPEASNECSKDTTNYSSAVSRFETPVRKSNNSLANYELTPLLSKQRMRTPSIYNFDCNTFNALRHEMSDRSEDTFLGFDKSLRPELTLSGFESFNSTITEDQNPMTASTPVTQMGSNTVEMILRPSRRISSINMPFSPRIGRPSLIDIQNVVENNNKNRKKKSNSSTKSKTKTKQTNEEKSHSNTSNSLNAIKKRRKKMPPNEESINMESMDISETSENTSQSLRNSRRNRKQVSYKEPSLGGKLRRPE